MKVSKFNEAISKLLTEKLKQFHQKTPNSTVSLQIYVEIFNSLVEVFQTSNIELTNEAMNYLAQQYYDSILINGTQELDPNIFDKRAKIENITTKELALLAVMLSGTDFTLPLIHEIKRRG